MSEPLPKSTLPGVNVSASAQERFFQYVSRGPGCWLWLGATDPNGYGRFWLFGRMKLSHHVSYWIHGGILQQPYLRHICNNPSCVNPSHLLAGTHAENMRDVAVAGTHGNRVLNPQDAWECHLAGFGLTQIGQIFGVSKQAVRAALIRTYGKDRYEQRA